MQIEEYRKRLESFHEKLNREHYLHYSGQKVTLDAASLYRENSDLFTADLINELRTEIRNTSPLFLSRRKSLSRLLAFAIGQHLEQSCADISKEIAEFEGRQTVAWDGRQIAYNQVHVELGNLPGAAQRRELEGLRLRAGDTPNSLRKERLKKLHKETRRLGYAQYEECYRLHSGIDYAALSASLEILLAETESTYRQRADDSFRVRLEIPLVEARRCDVSYWTRMRECDENFPRDLMLPALFQTLRDLGVDPEEESRIHFDVEDRAQKHPRALCAPIHVPREIRVVLLLRGGQDDYSALFHESGHAAHFAWTSPNLAAEHRLWGDRGLSETYAFLLEHLIWNEDWLRETLGFRAPAAFIRFKALTRVHLIRRYCAKLRFEIELHSNEALESPGMLYANLLQEITGIGYDPETYLEDTDNEFYTADYLRAWILEAQLRDYLRMRFGNLWHRSTQAGRFLKEIWETGQLFSVEELAREIGIGSLDVQVLTDELRAALRR